MRKGLLINLDRSSGCDSCSGACKLENDLPLGHFYNKVIAVGPTGTFPNVEKYWLPSQCQQCENPACVHVCPTAASYRDPETGMVRIDKEKCIGCQYCVMACPYGAISLESIGLPSATSETMAQKSMRSVAVRCDLCKDWMKREGKSVPACVEACPVHARSVVQIG